MGGKFVAGFPPKSGNVSIAKIGDKIAYIVVVVVNSLGRIALYPQLEDETFDQLTKAVRGCIGANWSFVGTEPLRNSSPRLMVELRGFEPLTSSVQGRRSPI